MKGRVVRRLDVPLHDASRLEVVVKGFPSGTYRRDVPAIRLI